MSLRLVCNQKVAGHRFDLRITSQCVVVSFIKTLLVFYQRHEIYIQFDKKLPNRCCWVSTKEPLLRGMNHESLRFDSSNNRSKVFCFRSRQSVCLKKGRLKLEPKPCFKQQKSSGKAASWRVNFFHDLRVYNQICPESGKEFATRFKFAKKLKIRENWSFKPLEFKSTF